MARNFDTGFTPRPALRPTAPVYALTDRTSGNEFRVRLTGHVSDGSQRITVYDARFTGERHPDEKGHEHTILGQEVSWLPTGSLFRQAYRKAGWAMDFGIPAWCLDAASIAEIADWVLAVTPF